MNIGMVRHGFNIKKMKEKLKYYWEKFKQLPQSGVVFMVVLFIVGTAISVWNPLNLYGVSIIIYFILLGLLILGVQQKYKIFDE